MHERNRAITDDLTVVIPTLGRHQLRSCLDAIASGTQLPLAVIVVHQGDEDDVEALAAECTEHGLPTRYVHSLARGTAHGTNAGIHLATSRFVAVTHDDCVPSPDWIATMAAQLRVNSSAIVTGQVRALGGVAPGLITDPERRLHTRPMLRRDPIFPDNMGFARATFDRVGDFDEDPRLRYAEDAEWSYRALRAGISVLYAPEIVVGHVAIRDLGERAATYRRYARSQGAFYGKYLRHRDCFVGVRALFDLARGPWMVLRGRLAGHADTVAYGRAYVRELLPGIVDGLRRS